MPYFLDGKVYVRNGSESIRASQERISKMISFKSLNSFDTSESAVQNLKFNEIKNIRAFYN